MRTNRVWIEIVILATAIACGIALLFATLGAAAGAAGSGTGTSEAVGGEARVRQEPQPVEQTPVEQTYQGMVTCSRCGARHSANLAKSASICVRVCVHGGASFALVDGDVTYLLNGDLDTLKKLAGQRASVVGALKGNTIRISSVVAQT